MALDNSSSTHSFNTTIHMVTIKSLSTNFLLWRSQVVPLLQCQKFYGYIDGSTSIPFATTNPTVHNIWKQNDQLVMSLLSSLAKEALSVVIELMTSKDVWTALKTTFNYKSKVHELQIKGELYLMKRGYSNVSEYSRVFKSYCDQLLAMG